MTHPAVMENKEIEQMIKRMTSRVRGFVDREWQDCLPSGNKVKGYFLEQGQQEGRRLKCEHGSNQLCASPLREMHTALF